MSRSDAILERLSGLHPKLIDLGLERITRLLAAMGDPQLRLPPVIHVAGTNGKGSTIAFLRAFLEAAGLRVHVFTSPHLVHFRERIRLAGTLVTDERLSAVLEACETVNAGQAITFFEITTAAAFQLFADEPADYLLLEVGLGGEFDSTNVIDHPLAAVITPVAIDHISFLGSTLGEIAKAKAGILKPGAAAIFGRQQDEALAVLDRTAHRLGITPFVAGADFDGFEQNGRLVYQDDHGLLDLPRPRMIGAHQIENAALAIAVIRHLGLPVPEAALATGLRTANWPARLSPLKGLLTQKVPEGSELWLDGSHNAHGALALAAALTEMNKVRPLPLVLVVGMMNTRPAADFFAPFKAFAPKVLTLDIPGEINAHKAADIATAAREFALDAEAAPSLSSALASASAALDGPARIVICGSLYLAGHVLVEDGSIPS